MKRTLQLEEGMKLLLAYWLSIHIGYSWWVFFVWLLVPDLSMIGYAFNARVGAFVYNIVHHQGIAIVTGVLGYYTDNPGLELAGIILFGHSAMDRIFGYGLKYPDDFKHTHLGRIGKPADKKPG